ncbi:hypothetical protein F9K79_00715 [Ochrobactrum sp. Kaboul]|nr:hypothetical protein F9K79_00715 [Ochrobactrum sp. Kaboul]
MNSEEIIKQVVSRAGVIKVRNVMNPTLWACAIVSPLSWVAAFCLRETSAFMVLIFVGTLPVLMYMVQTAYFSLKDPGRLQSEEFQLKHQALNLIEKKGQGEITDPNAVMNITEDDFAYLEMNGDKDE